MAFSSAARTGAPRGDIGTTADMCDKHAKMRTTSLHDKFRWCHWGQCHVHSHTVIKLHTSSHVAAYLPKTHIELA